MRIIIILTAISAVALSAENMEANSSPVIEELFIANSSRQLENALTDGYPLPWLEDMLNNESVPEDDRYWLDCRMRSIIAEQLHVFYDRNGYPREIDIKWIKPSEDYWRETFMYARVGEDLVTYAIQAGGVLRGEVGYLTNLHGESIGEIAIAAQGFSGSANSSVYASALCRVTGSYRLVIQYPDKQYILIPQDVGYGRCSVSQSGNSVLLAARATNPDHELDGHSNSVIMYNSNGDVRWETAIDMVPVGNPAPVISPDERYCCVVMQADDFWEADVRLMVQVFDAYSGQEMWHVDNPSGTRLCFSPNGRLLYLSGSVGEARCFDAETGEEVWNDQELAESVRYSRVRQLAGSNTAGVLAALIEPVDAPGEYFSVLVSDDGCILAIDEFASRIVISPNGYFAVTEGSSLEGQIHIVVRQIIAEE